MTEQLDRFVMITGDTLEELTARLNEEMGKYAYTVYFTVRHIKYDGLGGYVALLDRMPAELVTFNTSQLESPYESPDMA